MGAYSLPGPCNPDDFGSCYSFKAMCFLRDVKSLSSETTQWQTQAFLVWGRVEKSSCHLVPTPSLPLTQSIVSQRSKGVKCQEYDAPEIQRHRRSQHELMTEECLSPLHKRKWNLWGTNKQRVSYWYKNTRSSLCGCWHISLWKQTHVWSDYG